MPQIKYDILKDPELKSIRDQFRQLMGREITESELKGLISTDVSPALASLKPKVEVPMPKTASIWDRIKTALSPSPASVSYSPRTPSALENKISGVASSTPMKRKSLSDVAEGKFGQREWEGKGQPSATQSDIFGNTLTSDKPVPKYPNPTTPPDASEKKGNVYIPKPKLATPPLSYPLPPAKDLVSAPQVANEDIPPMGNITRNPATLNGTPDRKDVTLGAKSLDLPPANQELARSMGKLNVPNNPFKNVTQPDLPKATYDKIDENTGIATLPSAESNLTTTETKPTLDALDAAKAEALKTPKAQYGEKYKTYLDSVNEAKKTSRDALSGKYNEYLNTLDKNQKAEFWQNIIKSLGQLTAGAMNTMTKTVDGESVPMFGDVAGAYKPVDVYNKESADKLAESKFKAQEALGERGLQDTLSNIEATRKGEETIDVSPSTIGEKYAATKADVLKNAAAKLQEARKTGTQVVQKPIASNSAAAAANKPIQDVSKAEAMKNINDTLAVIAKEKIDAKINPSNVKDAESFGNLYTGGAVQHRQNVINTYKGMEAEARASGQNLTPAEIAKKANQRYLQIIATNDREQAEKYGIDMRVILNPGYTTPNQIIGKTSPVPNNKKDYRQTEVYQRMSPEEKALADKKYGEK